MKHTRLFRSFLSKWLFIAILLTISSRVLAANFVYNGITYTVVSEEEKTCQTLSNALPSDADINDLVLPETPNGYKLVKIGDYSFQGRPFTSVTIPNSVTEIGIYAFSGCHSLSKVNLSSSLSTLKGGAFYYCESLSKIIAVR